MRIHRKGFPWTGSSIVFKKFKVQEPKSFPRDHAESVKYTENVRIHVICVNTVEYPFAESNVLNVITRKSNIEFLLHHFFILLLFYRITIKKFSCKNSIVIQSLGIIFIDAGEYILFNWTRMERNMNNNNNNTLYKLMRNYIFMKLY